jgi:hypothetical protein
MESIFKVLNVDLFSCIDVYRVDLIYFFQKVRGSELVCHVFLWIVLLLS